MKHFLLILFLFNTGFLLHAQPVTGVWRGKLTSGSGLRASTARAELKLIAKGDSLVGTCYYFASAGRYIRYSVKGYFDKVDNTVHWWDDQMLSINPPGKNNLVLFASAMRSDADFNCPGNNVMKLDGTSRIGDGPDFVIHFDKIEKPIFEDEWDNVIKGYFTGMADREIIDSVYAITPPFNFDDPQVAIVKRPGRKEREEAKNAGDEKPVALIKDQSVGEVTETALVIPDPAIIASNTNPKEKPVAIPNQDLMKDPQVMARQEPSVIQPAAKDTNLPPQTVAKQVTPAKDTILPNSKTQVIEPAVVVKATPLVIRKDTLRQVETVAKQTTTAKDSLPKAVLPPPVIAKASTANVVKTDTAKQATTSVAKQTQAPDITSISAKTKPALVPPATVAKTVPPATIPPAPVVNSSPPVTKPPVVQPSVAKTTSPSDRKTETAVPSVARTNPVVIKPVVIPEKIDPVAVEKYVTRRKINQAEIPMVGDTMELNFYDNAEVDGDSISVFLNGKLLFNHVLLTAQAYTFRVGIKDLPNNSELTMVAENLGSIPPNTAYMVAIVDGQQYSARLESTEQTSGVIRLVRR